MGFLCCLNRLCQHYQSHKLFNWFSFEIHTKSLLNWLNIWYVKTNFIFLSTLKRLNLQNRKLFKAYMLWLHINWLQISCENARADPFKKNIYTYLHADVIAKMYWLLRPPKLIDFETKKKNKNMRNKNTYRDHWNYDNSIKSIQLVVYIANNNSNWNKIKRRKISNRPEKWERNLTKIHRTSANQLIHLMYIFYSWLDKWPANTKQQYTTFNTSTFRWGLHLCLRLKPLSLSLSLIRIDWLCCDSLKRLNPWPNFRIKLSSCTEIEHIHTQQIHKFRHNSSLYIAQCVWLFLFLCFLL